MSRRVRSAQARRRLAAALCGLYCVSALSAGIGHASVLMTTADGLGAGLVPVPICDADGLTLRYVSTGSGNVSHVMANAIAPACAGGELKVELVNGVVSVAAGSLVLPAVDFTGAVIVALSEQPAAISVTGVHAAIEGP